MHAAHRALVLTWLCVQVAFPLNYYLYGQFDDPVDERLAFRMFSLVDMGGTGTQWWYWRIGDSLDEPGRVLNAASAMGDAWHQRFQLGAPLALHNRVAWRMCEKLKPTVQAVAYERSYASWDGDAAGLREDVKTWRCV